MEATKQERIKGGVMSFEVVKEVSDKTISKRKLAGIYLSTFGLMMVASAIPIAGKDYHVSIWLALSLIPLVILMMVAHELLHGICFKIFTGKVKMGAKWSKKYGPIGYASSPGCTMTKNQMIVTLMMPQLIAVIGLIISFMYGFNPGVRIVAWMLAITSLGGGCLDIYWLWLLLREKLVTHVQDTEDGSILLKEVSI